MEGTQVFIYRALYYGIILLTAGVFGGVYIQRHYGAEDRTVRRLLWLLFVLPFLAGGYHICVSALVFVFLLWQLIVFGKQRSGLRLYLCDGVLAVLLLVLAYGITALWAADHGMAGYGFIKYLPLLFYVLLLMQLKKEQLCDFYCVVPLGGGCMVLLSFPLQFLPMLSDVLAPKGRLAGFMEYPNTFALFLLVGVVLQTTKKDRTRKDVALDAVLMLGIFASGSRTSFLLLLFVLIVSGLLQRNLKFAAAEIGAFAGCLLLSMLVSSLEVYSAAGRYLTTSVGDSTLLSRLLYFKDVLPVIAKHPFGLGYLGYSAVQGSIQHGVYTVTLVHNELLQLLVDIGWLPVALLCVALFQSFFAKGAGARRRLLMAVILGHCMMDFDLQFLSIWFLLLPLLELHKGKPVTARGGRIPAGIAGAVLTVLCLWLSTSDLLYQYGNYGACLKITPFHTMAMERKLTEISDPEELETLADRILLQSAYSSIAYSAKANAAFAKGDVEGMMAAEEAAIVRSPYALEEYTDYFDKLYAAMQLFTAQEDAQSAQVCRNKLLDIPNMLARVEENTDPLAWKLEHKPELMLPENYRQMLETVRETVVKEETQGT